MKHRLLWLALTFLILFLLLSFFPRAAANKDKIEPQNTAHAQQADLVIPNEQQNPNPPPPADPPKPKTGSHPIKANGKIEPDKLKAWLEAQKSTRATGSPLSDYSELILQSDYWSTIVAICYIEQYHCTSAPGNNYWGIGPGKIYTSLPAGIGAIDKFLQKAEPNHPTIEKLNCWYVQPCSSSWLGTVIKIKAQVEAL